jgi:hypothetical protein
MILTGMVLWVFNLYMTWRGGRPYDYRVDLVDSKEG